MSTPALAILWEIWRKNRWALLSILLAVPLWALLSRALCGPLRPEGEEALILVWPVLVFLTDIVPMWFSLLGLAVIFCYTEPDPQRGHARFPSRLFVLPVRTTTLVTCPMLYGVAALVLVALAWEKLVLASLPAVEWMPEHFLPLIYVGAAIVLLQATVWTLPGFPASRLIVLGVLLFGLTWLALWPLAHSGSGDWSPERTASFQRHSTMAMAAASLLAYVAALLAVERDRRGAGRLWSGGRERLCGFLEAWPRRRQPFPSAAVAQRWFEWRRGAGLLPLAVAFFLLLILGPIGWLVRAVAPGPARGIDAGSTATMLAVVLVLPFVLAFFIGKRQAENELNPTPFQFLRPVTTGELVVRKLQIAAWSTGLSWLMILVVTPVWLALWCDTSLLAHWWRALERMYGPPMLYVLAPLALVAAVALTWRGLVISLYLGLWGRPRIFIWSVAATVFGGWLLVMIIGVSSDPLKLRTHWLGALPWLGAALTAKGLVAGWAFCRAHRRGWLTARAIAVYVGLWLVMTSCLMALMLGLFSVTSVPTVVIVVTSALVFPLARIGLAPLALAAHRHR